VIEYFCLDSTILLDLISNRVLQSCHVQDVNVSLTTHKTVFLLLLILVMSFTVS